MSSGSIGNSDNGNNPFYNFLEIIAFMGNEHRKSRDAAPNGADFQKKDHYFSRRGL